jgi:hypothetical protein
LPIDLLARENLELACQRVVLSEENEVLAAPPCGRNDQAVATEKGYSGPDFLSAVIIDAFILRHVYVQLFEIRAKKPQSALGRHDEAVKDSRFAGPRRELAPMITDLCESPFTEQARVEDRNQPTRRPTAATGRLRERIEASAGRAKDVSVEALCSEGAEPL